MPSCGRRLLILLGTAIAAAAYRSVVEGRDGQPARPEVLRDLINDGALGAPICFGVAADLPRRCRTVATENPLLQWPQPFTDRPDHNYARQFTEPGQCVHFMGMLQDEASALLPGRHVPRALATSALVRCRDMLDDILRQVVLVGGVGTRESGYGLYELMHAVTDSFSHAHTERQPGTHRIDFLRVWGPIGKLAMSRLSDYFADSPLQHDADDPRDSSYVRNFAQVNGLPCKDLTALPYTVPFPCLSEEGDLARQALLELPFDRRAAVGFSPLSARYTLGGSSKGWDISTQAFHYEFHVAENIAVSVLGPVELDWRRVSLDWAFGVVVGYTPSRRHVAGGPLIGPPPSTVPRHDDQWAPEPLWFGHLKGVEST